MVYWWRFLTARDGLISDKTADEPTKVSRILPHNCSETNKRETENIQNLIEK